MEIWKDVIGYEGIYQISNKGRLKSLVRKSTGTNTKIESFLKRQKRGNGYYAYSLSKNGKSKHLLQHRLIAIHFIDNPEGYKCVNHKNGRRNDNSIENLEWCTHSQNSLHGYQENGRINSKRKLKQELVLEIREKLKNPYHGIGNDLANEYNVSKWIISLIRNFKTYKGLI